MILSPSNLSQFEVGLSGGRRLTVSPALHEKPAGMASAVFCGFPLQKCADDILVVWSDQMHVSISTLQRPVEAHRTALDFSPTMPLRRSPRFSLVLVGGQGLDFKGGRHLRYKPETPMNSLLLTMLDKAAGTPQESFIADVPPPCTTFLR